MAELRKDTGMAISARAEPSGCLLDYGGMLPAVETIPLGAAHAKELMEQGAALERQGSRCQFESRVDLTISVFHRCNYSFLD
jgi:hypothetical protein